ncbi:MAG: hypothetical protein WD048_14975 [Chitinophagales bacterium]
MKNLIFTLAFCIFVFAVNFSATAQEEKKQSQQTEIEATELPKALFKTLSTEKYSEWNFHKAYKVDLKTQGYYYKIELRKAQETALFKFDKNGNEFKEQEVK